MGATIVLHKQKTQLPKHKITLSITQLRPRKLRYTLSSFWPCFEPPSLYHTRIDRETLNTVLKLSQYNYPYAYTDMTSHNLIHITPCQNPWLFRKTTTITKINQTNMGRKISNQNAHIYWCNIIESQVHHFKLLHLRWILSLNTSLLPHLIWYVTENAMKKAHTLFSETDPQLPTLYNRKLILVVS